jgi:hypothetical protein
MVAPVLHRKWAREYLAHAEQAHDYSRKCRYLQLAVRNTVCAWNLEAEEIERESEVNSSGPAEDSPTPKH